MDQRTKESLKVIVDAAKKTPDGFVMSVELPVKNSDERKVACTELEREGYISKVDVHGQKYIQCQVEPAAYEAVK